MNTDEYQVLVHRTARIGDDMGFNRLVVALGLNGEAGELGDAIKKEVGHGHPEDRDKVLDEAGDVLWYLTELLTLYQLRLADVMEGNIDKLRKRYPEGFSTEASINRAD